MPLLHRLAKPIVIAAGVLVFLQGCASADPSAEGTRPIEAAPSAAAPAVLSPGSVTPNVDVKEWLKGAPVGSFEKDRTYVVEFWATWCGPCLESIPHLTQLASKHAEVRFVGISVLEDNDKGQVRQFVEKMGDKMAYTVGYSGNKTGMASSWLAAAKQGGIPSAFIVRNNTVLWIGHPMGLDTPLTQIAASQFDVAAAKKSFDASLAARERREKRDALLEEAAKLYDSGNIKTAKANLDRVERDPGGVAAAEPLRFKWLCLESPEAWRLKAAEALAKSDDKGSELAVFADHNATLAPDQCKWLFEQVSGRYPDNWYVWLCGARMARRLKELDTALVHADQARQVILEHQRQNPDAPKGNALEVIGALESQIKKERG